MAISSFCYQITIPDSADRLGKSLQYTPYDGTPVQVFLDDMGGIFSTVGVGETTYYICSRTYPTFTEFGQQIDPSFYSISVTGGSSPCTSDADCLPNGGGGGGGGSVDAYCYQIAINTTITSVNAVQFSYTPSGSGTPSTIQARNWSQTSTSGSTSTLYLCSSSYPTILIYDDPVLDPDMYGITISGGTSTCTTDDACWVQPPVNCTLSDWGYGETMQTFTVGAWSPCQIINGSPQQYQTRYVVTPASNGGTCLGETVRYQSCTIAPSGSVATLTTPTFTNITSTSVTATTTVSNNGGSDVTQVTFRIFNNGTLVNAQVLTDFRFGISVQFTGLTPNTQYTVKAFGVNSTGTGESPTGTFSTVATGGITTPVISGLTQTGATSTSTFTNSSGDQFSKFGVIYKVGSSTGLEVGLPGVVKLEGGPLQPEVSPAQLVSTLTGLTPNTTYYLKSYVQGATYVYSSAQSFTTSGAAQGEPSVQLSLSSIALNQSAHNDAYYNFITNPAATPTRSYVSVIESIPDDPIPGAYKLLATMQEVEPNSIMWILETKLSPSDTDWLTLSQVTVGTDLNTILPPPMWTYYTYADQREYVVFRPEAPGYYRFTFRGVFLNGTQFNLKREIVIGRPVTDLALSYSELRQGVSANIQVSTDPVYPEWIPEFTEDGMYGLSITQTGETIVPTLNINSQTRSFSALWGIKDTYERLAPTLAVAYTSPFKNFSLSNSFSKNFNLSILPPLPIINFSNLAIFNSPVTAGGNVTIGVSTLYAKDYTITSVLNSQGQGVNSPVTYSNVQPGTYTITATATNDSSPNIQTSIITRDLVVQAAAPILSQLPQQKVGRNLFIDINTLPYVNLNGSSFSNLEVSTQPSQGTLTVTNYSIRYIPNQNYTGTDLFTFRVKSSSNTYSNYVNVSILTVSPSFNVGVANETITFNSTEVNGARDLVVPITNSGTISNLEINSIELDQDSTDFKFVLTSGQTETEVNVINDITIAPGDTYNIKIRVEPTAIGTRTAKLKIDHN